MPGVLSVNLTINNYGLRNFNISNQEYTPYYSVVLLVDSYQDGAMCRFCNDNSSEYNYCLMGSEWSLWQECKDFFFWELVDFSLNGSAEMKYVFMQEDIDLDGTADNFANDTIYYDFTGKGLDLTPPERGAIIYDGGNYTAFNNSISVWWDSAYDKESDFLKIPFVYEVRVLENSTPLTGWFNVGEQKEVKINLPSYMIKGNNYTVEVKTINSVNMSVITQSDGIFYDDQKPILTIDYLDGSNWTNNSKIDIYFSGFDIPSGVKGFSYKLTGENNFVLDDRLDAVGTIANVSYFLPSGIFYFYVKAIDNAGNIGDVTRVPIFVDITPPTKPRFNSSALYYYNENISWIASNDEDSGVIDYYIEASYDLDFDSLVVGGWINSSNTSYDLSNLNLTPGYYYIRIKAKDLVGQESVFSNQQDFLFDNNPPIITRLFENSFLILGEESFSIETNENAECYYLRNGNYTNFDYSGFTYHETYLKNFFDKAETKDIIVRCIDRRGNIADSSFSITAKNFNSFSNLRIYPSEEYENSHLAQNSKLSQYVGSRIHLKLEANPKFSGLFNKFDFELNPVEIDSEVFERYLKQNKYFISEDVDFSSFVFRDVFIFDYGLSYSGNGIYDLILEVPNIPGVYELVVSAGNIVKKVEFEVLGLELMLSYVNLEGENANLTNLEENMLFYKFSNYSFGIASSSKGNFFLLGNRRDAIDEKDLTNHDISIKAPINTDMFFLLTRNTKSFDLKSQDLLNGKYKYVDGFNFGFSTDFQDLIEVSLIDKNILFVSEKEFNPGKYTLFFENKGEKDSTLKEIFLDELTSFSYSKEESKYTRYDTYG